MFIAANSRPCFLQHQLQKVTSIPSAPPADSCCLLDGCRFSPLRSRSVDYFLLYAYLIYGIAAANQIWLAVSLRLPRRGQWKVRDEPVRHFLNDLVVGRAGLNGACVIALRSNTARNVREGCIIKTSTTDRLLVLSFFFHFCEESNMNCSSLAPQ